MNNGGLENRYKHEKSQKKSKSSKFSSKSDDFALAMAKVAAAQVCESIGFQSFQHSALEKLSDIIARYIYSLGKAANLNANLAGRVEANVFDVIQGLEELGSGLGFAGASDVDRCLVNSGVIRDIVRFVGDAVDIPFAYDFPKFPVVKEWKEMGSFSEKGEEPPEEHIPSWLPTFPDPETYTAHLSEGNEMMSLSNGEKTEVVMADKMERPLLNLQQHFACNGNAVGSSCGGEDAIKAKEASESNPYLAAPIHFGEKGVEVSPAAPPAKLSEEFALRNPVPENCAVGNHVSVLETFAPAIEAMRSGLCDSENDQKKVLHNQRPMVHFKIRVGKKPLGMAPGFSSHKKNPEKIASCFGTDNEKDEKKRRAEKILKESIESSGSAVN